MLLLSPALRHSILAGPHPRFAKLTCLTFASKRRRAMLDEQLAKAHAVWSMYEGL